MIATEQPLATFSETHNDIRPLVDAHIPLLVLWWHGHGLGQDDSGDG